jgi:hypothetical protein
MKDAAEFAAIKESLKGDRGKAEARLLRAATKLTPMIQETDGVLAERRATFDWMDSELGRVGVELTMPKNGHASLKNKWYLHW